MKKILYGFLCNLKLKTLLHSGMLFIGLIFLCIQIYGAVLIEQDRLNALNIYTAITGFLLLLYIISYILNISTFSKIRKISDALENILQGKKNVKLPKEPNDELAGLWQQLEKIAAHEEDRNRLSYELVLALKKAEVSNIAKSEFLTNMSHELKTPLNSIIGFSEIMTCDYLSDDLNDKYREYAHDIRNSGLSLLNIINNLLDLSYVAGGVVELTAKEVVARDIIGESIRLIEGSAKAKSISIKNTIYGELPLLYVDEDMIYQILNNILSNAVKFTPAGGNIVINASLKEDGTFCIAISDTGIGIAKDKIDTVTSPFCQINDSYTREQEGTGLGLTLAKAFMDLHGGQIRLESAWGVGTTVYVIFPSSCLSRENFQQDNALLAVL